MAEPLTVTEAQERAETLLERARHHKSEARRHRRRSRRAMEDLENLRRRCAEFGLDLVVRQSPRRTEP